MVNTVTSSQFTSYKRKYSLSELYQASRKLPASISVFIKNRKSGLVEEKFIERLQLAVTEVNGCAVCSYAHTKMALEMGMTNEEIASFLGGEKDFISDSEAKAIAFAQHYADSGGKPDEQLYNTIIEEYGEDKSRAILAAVQVMMVANMYGIPMSAFMSRRKGKPYPGSTLWYELNMMITGLPVMSIALLHGLINKILGVKVI